MVRGSLLLDGFLLLDGYAHLLWFSQGVWLRSYPLVFSLSLARSPSLVFSLLMARSQPLVFSFYMAIYPPSSTGLLLDVLTLLHPMVELLADLKPSSIQATDKGRNPFRSLLKPSGASAPYIGSPQARS